MLHTAPARYGDAMPIAEHIACMECGGEAHLAQPLQPDDDIRAGDVLVYLCGACAQRWDVVVDEDDIDDDGDSRG